MNIELIEQNQSLINDQETPQLKKSNSLLEYIINHRQDILEKIEQERNNTANNVNKPIHIDDINSLQRKIEYIDIIRWLGVFCIFGFLGGIFINAISKTPLVNYDMIFNLMISPIIYYHSPRNILCNIPISDFLKYYTVFFIFGLFFRFLDLLEDFNDFSLDPLNIKTNTQIGLTIFISILLSLLSIYFIVISSNPILNTLLFLFEFSIFITASYVFIILNGKIHIHHYFIGLILMLVSKNYHSKIVIITHAISYGIYIEGISKWGIDPLYWKT